MWRFIALLFGLLFPTRYYGYRRTPRSPLYWIGMLLGMALFAFVLHFIYQYYLTTFASMGD